MAINVYMQPSSYEKETFLPTESYNNPSPNRDFTLYNFTVTFNPNVYTLCQSWHSDTDINTILTKYSSFFHWVKEITGKHCPLEKRTSAYGYAHYHGQIFIKNTPKGFPVMALRKALHKFGRAVLLKNELKKELKSLHMCLGIEQDLDSESAYPTYYEYTQKYLQENKLLFKNEKFNIEFQSNSEVYT